MKSFEYNGKRVEFRSVTGAVMGHNKNAISIVEGSGGGGSSFQGNGYTAPVNIKTRVEIKQDFSLKPDQGNEVPFHLNNEDIPLRDGLNVTMISGHTSDKFAWTHLVNHNAARYWKLGSMGAHVYALGLARNPFYSFLIGVGGWVAIATIVNSGFGGPAAVAFWIYEGMNFRKISKALEAHLDDLGREMLNNGMVPNP